MKTTTSAPIVPGPDQQWVAKDYIFQSSKNLSANLQTITTFDFENKKIPDGWTAFNEGSIAISSTAVHGGGSAICMTGRKDTWNSPAFNIYDTIKKSGAGTYTVTFWAYCDVLPGDANATAGIIVRGGSAEDANSFLKLAGGQYYTYIQNGVSLPAKAWTKFEGKIHVTASDITRPSGIIMVMLDLIKPATNQHLYVDDLTVKKGDEPDVLNTIQFSATFKGPNNTVMVMPGFWDGGSTFKVRFAPTLLGKWTYTTSCNDKTDKGLNNKTGSFTCTKYAGDLDIFKHGFVKTVSNARYFQYSDGTPFFYVGDMHCNMMSESFYSSTQVNVLSQFKYLVNERVKQGFTVYQSEPLGATYNLDDGISETDIAGFDDMDARYKYISSMGLVHANEALFFQSNMSNKVYALDKNGQNAYLDNLCKMWVARFAAYPVIWTTAQECDFTVPVNGVDISTIGIESWKYVATLLHKYDPYKHPLSAHSETTAYGYKASNSIFKNIPGHSFFAVQYTAPNNSPIDYTIPEDFWKNGQGKPYIDYEPCFDHLWNMEYGVRMAAWAAMLNGFAGTGYGAEDIWLFNSDYDVDTTTNNGRSTVTPKDKAMKWYDSIKLPSAVQVGTYMRNFFNSFNWYKLVPCFDDEEMKYIHMVSGEYSAATIGNQTYVAYFYNQSFDTGAFLSMQAGKTYTAKWFNPVNGKYTVISASVKGLGEFGYWQIPQKPDRGDWVVYMTMNK